ncbi:MAG: ATP-binding cassette domain-containing protein [Lentisphaerae bacterium]|jgi:ABC-2 type transport system ATP-binding protein|nr:ATP-binding cassette domain-containing protein [Lentisphaerota bacterium]MBT4823456.1 ATP-binding cassette domain-containing protein [Lentisphaerota bacterium]MBT5608093.1 ATP-binding cassette domain-containing protein [Lentisphaerota bacterium]MBT7060630.1 ATP-binding cassette domain-containing protein [Lentisphaerota bacterium]MBT7847729.1 ATP-binding cassette domain-containing protein [Lentisphaerota bacterium]
MIRAQNVMKWFGPNLAVDDVSFEVQKGEVLGFLGPNGAGKSTTMRIVTGFLPLSGGKVEVGGHDIEEDPIGAKSLIGYLPENAPSYPEMTVEAFLGFVAELRGFKGTAKREAVERVITTCFLERVRHQPIDTLSKGYTHRTCFAQSIIHDPPVLVLDEPTDGLDPNQKQEVRDLIKSMGKEKAIIISTHILEEVDAICSRLIIIDRGKLVFNGTPDELKQRSDISGAVTVRVLSAPSKDVAAVLGGHDEVSRVDVLSEADGACVLRAFPKSVGETCSAAALSKLLQDKGWSFDELHTEEGRLDEVFRTVTIPDTVPTAGASSEEDSK